MPKRPKPPCIYCGVRPGTTRDHIPPKSLFAKPRPELLTVPCCPQCRDGQSLDDEYFVRMISLRDGTTDSPSARAARDSALRSITKPSKVRFSLALRRSISEVNAYSPAGIYLGQRLSYSVNLPRLCKVIERTTFGLYFHEYGHTLPDSHRSKVYAADGFETATPDIVATFQTLWEHALSGRKRSFGENIFTYWTQPIEGPEAATSWAFLIYGFVPFYAFTGPKPDIPI